MSFTISGTVITQTAGTTDTSWDGLNGLAGVTRVSMGDGFLYYCPNLGIDIAGTVTIADPSKSTVIPYFLHVLGKGIYTSGSFAADGVTPKASGIHFQAFGPTTSYSDTLAASGYGVAPGGRSTLIGGSYYINGGIFYANGAIIREYGVDKYAVKANGTSSIRVRAYGSDVIYRTTRHYDVAYDLFRMPTEFSAKAFGSEYLMQYVGAVAGGADAKFVAYAPGNVDGTYDFDNYGAGWVELYNSAKGAALNVVIQNPTASYRNTHVVPLFQEVNFKVTNLAGGNIQNARFKSTDAPVGSPTTTITTASSLKTWDFRNPLSYTGTTNASGVAASVPILQVWWGTGNTKNLRFPDSAATYQFRTYDYQTQDTSIVLGSDTAIAKGMALVPLTTSVTVTESVASALTGITFTASGATGGSVVISANRTLQDLWNYYRAWICQFANWGSTDTWTCSAGTLNMDAWTLTVNSGSTVSPVATIDSLVSPTITNNGAITALYTSGGNPSARLTLPNLTASSIYMADNSAAQYDFKANQAGTVVEYFAPGKTGTWGWVAERYGYKRQTGTFTPGVGGDFAASITWLADAGLIVTSSATVAAYTSLDNPNMVYDYVAYWRTTNTGITVDKLIKDGTVLRFGDANVYFSNTATVPLAYNASTNTITIKSTTFSAGSVMTSFATTGAVTVESGTTIGISYTDSSGTRVFLTNRNSVIMTSYVLINGTPVGGASVGGSVIPGFVPLVASRALTVQASDTVRMVVNAYGFKPQVINCTGANLDAFTVTLELENGVDISGVTTTTRDTIAGIIGFVQASPTQIDITLLQTLAAYYPKDCIAGVAYAFVTKGYLAFAAMASANSANIYSLGNGQMVTYSPGFKLRMADTDALSAAIVPTATGYSVPLVAFYYNTSTGVASPVTVLNASNAKIETAPWTQATATLSEADKASIAAKVDASTVLAKAGATVNANIKYVNDVPVNGTGAEGDEWGPAT